MNYEILLTGASGLLGQYLKTKLLTIGNVISTSRYDDLLPCDVEDSSSVKKLLNKVNPNIIVHTVALTDVDKCEQYPIKARSLNITSTENIIKNIHPSTYFVYISTDQVYPNTDGPHSENNSNPINIYGKTKLEAEKKVLQLKNSLVIRTNFIGKSLTKNRNSLSDFFIYNLREMNKINAYNDTFFSPLHMNSLSRIIIDMMNNNVKGVYNVGSRDGLSKAEFCLLLAKYLGYDSSKVNITNSPLSIAPRPFDLRMNVKRIEKLLGYNMPSLKEEIITYFS